MNITPTEAEEALTAVQNMMQKTRRAISSSGAYKFLILWGVIWMFGFLGSQFLPAQAARYAWISLDIVGAVISAIIGARMNRGVRLSAAPTTGKRIAFFWLLLFIYCYAAVAISWPVDAKQLALMIILFSTVGWVAMGLLLSFASVWWGLGLFALSLIGYFLLPGYFFLWMAILGGGGMIALGIYIRYRW
ncbi:MAG: hypothetical protein C3F13_13340 [Anaerolineales bacterium]|nr:hypothetical protein [Anaerolineae bacterium]PWB51421.1 MAG: hypothetical protein C3F13_13340 [Anaerolineales bacterium]